MKPKIMLIGGDNSSDRFGAGLAQRIKEQCPQACLFGVGGPVMEAAGVNLVYDISEMVSLGAFQSIKGSQVVKRLIRRVSEAMDKEQMDLVLQIGLPVFEYRLLEIARAKEIFVAYYYTPLSRGLSNVQPGLFPSLVNKVVGVSRQETALCQELGIDAEFVGHPLMDLLDFSLTPATARAELSIPEDAVVIVVLPGTREVEVKHVLPTVLKALRQIGGEVEDAQVIVSLAPTISDVFIDRLLKNQKSEKIRLERGYSGVLHAADLAITSVGTSSLEASLLGIPSLAVYRVPCTTYFVDKLLDRKPYMTTTNNILRNTVIPEFVQSEFSYAQLAEVIKGLLLNEEDRRTMLMQFERLRHELGDPGSLARAATLILEMAGNEHGIKS